MAYQPLRVAEFSEFSELTILLAVAILQIARNRAPPVRGKGLSHLIVEGFKVGLSSARYSGRRATKKEASCQPSSPHTPVLNT